MEDGCANPTRSRRGRLRLSNRRRIGKFPRRASDRRLVKLITAIAEQTTLLGAECNYLILPRRESFAVSPSSPPNSNRWPADGEGDREISSPHSGMQDATQEIVAAIRKSAHVAEISNIGSRLRGAGGATKLGPPSEIARSSRP